jgi:multiple sugar transport system permease protein
MSRTHESPMAVEPLRHKNPTRTPFPVVTIVAFVALASLIPFAYLLIVSLRPASPGGSLGGLWRQLFASESVLKYMTNSAIVSLTSTVLVIFLSCLAGFGFAKLSYPGSKLAFAVVVAAISVPSVSIILPNYLNLARLGGVNSYWAPVLLYVVGGIPFATILMTSYFRSIPDEVVESAVLDGAPYWRVFSSVMAPMAVPAMVTVGVLSFLGAWNDLLIGLLFLPDPSMRTISVGVAALEGVRASNIDLALTGSLLSALPPLMAFVLFQRYLVSGITAGMSR